ncbi:phosphorylcholine phosphatase [Streptomyces sp. NBRC 110611]|uniref:hypothetical protein n=1 Tax=Streptomyces sp. NBRC 110611 TaxID=1621259 RepID=UPI00082A5341|nr:hypothetical protein [Streptomyces sp. NBRC 110611]GAU65231.1 phosphorylcholine phosphatase [Streptomyces sp. NBRC 110611]
MSDDQPFSPQDVERVLSGQAEIYASYADHSINKSAEMQSYLMLAKHSFSSFAEQAYLNWAEAKSAEITQKLNEMFAGKAPTEWGSSAAEDVHRVLSEPHLVNAFADHFLQDSFSAGHLRLPQLKSAVSQWYRSWAGEQSPKIAQAFVEVLEGNGE